MIRKLTLLTLALASCAGAVFAQAPSAPSATQAQRPAAQPAAQPAGPPGNKVGVINIEQAILMTNEGQRDFGAAQKKLEPKRTELENQNKELETMRADLTAQGDKLNEAARAERARQIDVKGKAFQRNYEDFQQEVQQERSTIGSRIGQKLVQVLDDFAKKNGYAVIIDISNPQGVQLWAHPGVDVTKEIVDAYNAQSGVPAPPRPATTGSTQGTNPAARPATQPQRPAGQPR